MAIGTGGLTQTSAANPAVDTSTATSRGASPRSAAANQSNGSTAKFREAVSGMIKYFSERWSIVRRQEWPSCGTPVAYAAGPTPPVVRPSQSQPSRGESPERAQAMATQAVEARQTGEGTEGKNSERAGSDPAARPTDELDSLISRALADYDCNSRERAAREETEALLSEKPDCPNIAALVSSETPVSLLL